MSSAIDVAVDALERLEDCGVVDVASVDADGVDARVRREDGRRDRRRREGVDDLWTRVRGRARARRVRTASARGALS